MKSMCLWGAAVSLLASISMAGTINVPADQPTIQAGVDAATTGDTVLIAPGTYTGDGNRDLDFFGKTISLIGSDGPAATVVDLGGSETEPHRAIHLHSGEGKGVLIEGLTITHGYDAALYYDNGMLWFNGVAPTVRNCRIVGNHGTGIYAVGGNSDTDTLFIFACVIDSNASRGVYCAGPCLVLDSCTVSNGGSHGVDVHWYSDGTVTRSLFTGNSSSGLHYMPMMSATKFLVANCTFVGNGTGMTSTWDWARSGPGAELSEDTITITRNLFAGNQSRGLTCSSPFGHVVTCNDFHQNTGGDFFFSAVALDTIGNIRLDPRFCDTGTGNYVLDDFSPCLAGNSPCGVLIGALDQGCTCCRIMGDFYHDGGLAVNDLTAFVNHLFKGGSPPPCPTEMDLNYDGAVNVADLTRVVYLLFKGGVGLTCP